MKNNVSRTYLRSVLRSVPCTHKQKTKFRHDLTESVNAYCIDNPNAQLTDLIRVFGSPEQIASAWINDYADSYHVKYQHTKQTVIRIVAVAAVVAAVTLVAISAVDYVKEEDYRNGYVVDRITEDYVTGEDELPPVTEVH